MPVPDCRRHRRSLRRRIDRDQVRVVYELVVDSHPSRALNDVEVPVVDTTGAGDSFLAGFLASYLNSRDILKSLHRGADLASEVIQHIGAY